MNAMATHSHKLIVVDDECDEENTRKNEIYTHTYTLCREILKNKNKKKIQLLCNDDDDESMEEAKLRLSAISTESQ